jgi:putative membrane protein
MRPPGKIGARNFATGRAFCMARCRNICHFSPHFILQSVACFRLIQGEREIKGVKMKTIIWTASLLLGLSLAAARAYADDMTVTNETVTPLSSQDFVTTASWAGDKEIALGQIALEKSQNPAVTNFAAEMIRDHTRISDRLARIADREGLTCVPTNSFAPENWPQDIENFKGMEAQALMTPTSTTNDDLMMAKYLDSLSGADFDRAYANCAVEDHTNAVQLFTDASQTLQDKTLKRFAKRTLPTLRDHYQMAVMMQNEVSTNSMTALGMKFDVNATRRSGFGL